MISFSSPSDEAAQSRHPPLAVRHHDNGRADGENVVSSLISPTPSGVKAPVYRFQNQVNPSLVSPAAIPIRLYWTRKHFNALSKSAGQGAVKLTCFPVRG